MPNARTLAERLARGRTLRRRLPRPYGPATIVTTPDSQLKYLKPGPGAFDPSLLRVVDLIVDRGDVVWDLGANVGIFSFASGRRVAGGSVLAVEADPWLCNLLARSAQLSRNDGIDLEVLCCAVSDSNGCQAFVIASRGRAANSLASVEGRGSRWGERERRPVACLTLDTIAESRGELPTVLKIDVEGAEDQVLRGARHVLDAGRPRMYLEVSEANSHPVTDILNEHDYRLFSLDQGSLKISATSAASWDTIAVHCDDPAYKRLVEQAGANEGR